MREKSFIKSPGHVWAERKREIRERTTIPQYPTGIESLDKIINGFAKGKVTVISGRTSEAKTSFALQSAFHQSDLGKPVLYITLEDDVGQLMERIFCNIRQVDNQTLLKGSIDEAVLNDVNINKLFWDVKFRMVQDYGYTLDQIKELIDDCNPRPEMVYLDYVQMIDPKENEKEFEAISNFSRECKKFAEQNDIGLVIVSQINRQGANEGRPRAHHLSGSTRLEQMCDLLLILYCPFVYKDSSFDFEETKDKKFVSRGMKECPPDYVEVIVEKNKNGERNRIVRTRFTGRFYKFEEWS